MAKRHSLSRTEYRVLAAASKHRNKFKAKRTVVDGQTFGSKREAEVICGLQMQARAGLIKDLVLQPRYDLVVNGVLVGRYTADARYTEVATMRAVVVDVKGGKATQTEASSLRMKVFAACYPGITLRIL